MSSKIYTELTDEDLVLKIKTGDDDAKNELFERCYTFYMKTGHRIIKRYTPEEKEDIAHATLTNIWISFPTLIQNYNPLLSKFKTYLMKKLWHLTCNEFKQSKKQIKIPKNKGISKPIGSENCLNTFKEVLDDSAKTKDIDKTFFRQVSIDSESEDMPKIVIVDKNVNVEDEVTDNMIFRQVLKHAMNLYFDSIINEPLVAHKVIVFGWCKILEINRDVFIKRAELKSLIKMFNDFVLEFKSNHFSYVTLDESEIEKAINAFIDLAEKQMEDCFNEDFDEWKQKAKDQEKWAYGNDYKKECIRKWCFAVKRIMGKFKEKIYSECDLL